MLWSKGCGEMSISELNRMHLLYFDWSAQFEQIIALLGLDKNTRLPLAELLRTLRVGGRRRGKRIVTLSIRPISWADCLGSAASL